MKKINETTEPLDPGTVRVRDIDGVLEFTGERVTDSTSDENNDHHRWTDLVLYRLTDGSGRYVLQTIGRSIIYPAVDGCERGVHTKLADLADRYLDDECEDPVPEPCPVCQPLDIEADDLGDTIVKMEIDRYAAHVCRDVGDLLQRLRLTRSKSPGQFSMPALLLLDRAKVLDEGIAEALSQVRRL